MENVDIFAKKQGGGRSDSTYTEEYEEFLNKLREQEVSAAEVGELIARMAQHFATHNLMMTRALRVFTKAARDLHSGIDAAGKPISAAKADVMSAATDESAAYQEARVHVQNIEQIINALKALQRGLLLEYANV